MHCFLISHENICNMIMIEDIYQGWPSVSVQIEKKYELFYSLVDLDAVTSNCRVADPIYVVPDQICDPDPAPKVDRICH